MKGRRKDHIIIDVEGRDHHWEEGLDKTNQYLVLVNHEEGCFAGRAATRKGFYAKHRVKVLREKPDGI